MPGTTIGTGLTVASAHVAECLLLDYGDVVHDFILDQIVFWHWSKLLGPALRRMDDGQHFN